MIYGASAGSNEQRVPTTVGVMKSQPPVSCCQRIFGLAVGGGEVVCPAPRFASATVRPISNPTSNRVPHGVPSI